MTNQADSRTAVAASVAAELRGIRGADQAEWFREQMQLDIGDRGRKDALKRRKARSPWDQKRGRKAADETADGTSEPDNWLWDSVEVDPGKLDLQQAIILLPGIQHPEPVLAHLRSTIGVVRIFETYSGIAGALILAHVIYMGAKRRELLDAQLRELQVPFEWQDLRSVVPSRPFEATPEAATWEALSRQLAELENLRLNPVQTT